MGSFEWVVLALALWSGAVAPANLVPVEMYINIHSSEEDRVAALAFVRSVGRVVESSSLLEAVESDMFSRPGTFEIHLDLVIQDKKLATSWEVWLMDDHMRRNQIWRSGLSYTEVDASTLVWKGNALLTKQAIRVVQALEQIELNAIEQTKIRAHIGTYDL